MAQMYEEQGVLFLTRADVESKSLKITHSFLIWRIQISILFNVADYLQKPFTISGRTLQKFGFAALIDGNFNFLVFKKNFQTFQKILVKIVGIYLKNRLHKFYFRLFYFCFRRKATNSKSRCITRLELQKTS